ncbi:MULTISPECIES: hypothetical protein [Paenibacillus]|uniref:Uncharacterized protein n=1 Tax=Paenibacillus naphthalenovorans TaxID=162209 RepID=A0A0U2VY08_9BACL|nr:MULTISPECIES: hypothetical protein [Paenibacillus]ALS21188.1 hypothetical protein IJ22_08060 [Paenibacillus naphthalenovorans]GCL72446.1 hypothetical protein PN4B1_23730 [Paenibacillus naphthalenovorans]SDI00660.1 hypothetical protein SAMN05421868_102208 [Paenibacillus naphthalenovorans]
MHTTDLIRTSDFAFELDGQPVSFEQIFPGFHAADRVGIVVRDSGGSIGASGLLAASIAKFYDFYREHLGNGPDKLRIYPDYYVFHVGIRHLDHYWMDIWPPHKEVVVGDEPELVLEAINDRGITRLLVQDAVPYQAAALYEPIPEESIDPECALFLQETISSAEKRILTSLAYSPSGRTRDGDIRVRSTQAAENLVAASIRGTENLSTECKERLLASRLAMAEDRRITETYRRIALGSALCMLANSIRTGVVTRGYMAKM